MLRGYCDSAGLSSSVYVSVVVFGRASDEAVADDVVDGDVDCGLEGVDVGVSWAAERKRSHEASVVDGFGCVGCAGGTASGVKSTVRPRGGAADLGSSSARINSRNLSSSGSLSESAWDACGGFAPEGDFVCSDVGDLTSLLSVDGLVLAHSQPIM